MWALALGIIALPATLQAQDKPAETEMIITKDQLSLTLNEAVCIALEKSPTLQATLLGIDGAKYDQKKNRGSLLPKVSLSGSYSYMLKKQKVYFGDMGGSGSPMGSFFPDDGIEMGQTHSLQGGVNAGMALIAPQLWASLKLDKEAVALAEEKAHGSKIDLVAEVKKAYMAVLLAQESLRVLEANYANAQANYKDISNKYQHGLVAEYDKIRMETQMKNVLPNVVAARTAVRLAEAKLKVVMGVPLETPITVAASTSSRVAPGRARRMFSSAVSARIPPSCKTMAVQESRSWLEASRTSVPPRRTPPDSTSQKRAARRTRVDLPPPEGPTTAVTVPGRSSRCTSSRTSGSPAR